MVTCHPNEDSVVLGAVLYRRDNGEAISIRLGRSTGEGGLYPGLTAAAGGSIAQPPALLHVAAPPLPTPPPQAQAQAEALPLRLICSPLLSQVCAMQPCLVYLKLQAPYFYCLGAKFRVSKVWVSAVIT